MENAKWIACPETLVSPVIKKTFNLSAPVKVTIAVTGLGFFTLFLNGKRVYDSPSLQEIRQYCLEQVDTLWDEVKRFDNPHKYYVDLSDKLWGIQQDLLRKSQEIK